MLDGSINQAAGLQGLASSPGVQLIALVSHGDDAAELPLLWQLCSTLVALGYPVTVLDGTSWENPENAGLSQLMDHTYRARHDSELRLPWSIIPSAWGLSEVAQDVKVLQRLGSIFGQDDLLILYANAQTLASLLGRTRCTPLLTLSDNKNSLLTSYVALKRLMLQGQLTPLIANIVPTRHTRSNQRQNRNVMNLLECAKNFLGFQGWVLDIASVETTILEDMDVRRLALGLLETAVSLCPPDVAAASAGTMGAFSSLRNH